MTKKPIDRLYGLPLGLILVLGLAKYLDLFPVPAWLFAGILVWGAIAFLVDAVHQRKSSH